MKIDLESKVNEIFRADPAISKTRLQKTLRAVGIPAGNARIGPLYRKHRANLGNLGGLCQ